MTLPPWRIIVFDNASIDGSVQQITDQFPNVLLLRSETNLGFTGANNEAIRYALNLGAEHVWVLNNDTTVEQDCLEKLIRSSYAMSARAVLGAKILHADPPHKIWYGGAYLNPVTFRAPHDAVGQTRSAGPQQPCQVDFITGCSMLIPRQALDSVGLFDERFFAYNEDFDWCLRARQQGVTLLYVPQAVLYHKVSASMTRNALEQAGGTAAPLTYYLTTRNFLWVVQMHGNSLQIITATSIRLLQVIVLSAGMVVLRRWEKVSAVWRGVRDGLRRPTHKSLSSVLK